MSLLAKPPLKYTFYTLSPKHVHISRNPAWNFDQAFRQTSYTALLEPKPKPHEAVQYRGLLN